jgi:excisionase family DNA binding protein
MGKRTEEMTKAGSPAVGAFPKMMSPDEVQEILNLGKPLVYALVKSAELRAAQFGGRGILFTSISHGSPRPLRPRHAHRPFPSVSVRFVS